MAGPTVSFWQARFDSGQTPWDRGEASPQLAEWLRQGQVLPGERVLVPGCGRGWEVAALARHGARVTGIDYAPSALAQCRQLLEREGVEAELVEADVLAWSPEASADVVYEQTCLCALHPDHWVRYAGQLRAWLRPGGRLLAMLAQLPRASAAQGVIEGPPYHLDIHAVRALLPSAHWQWPKPPYPAVAHPIGMAELAVVLKRL